MNKLQRNCTYLARIGIFWYIIQQSGQRSWEAVCFSHVNGLHKPYFHGNATDILAKMKPYEIHSVNENGKLRRLMFEILKTGKVEL